MSKPKKRSPRRARKQRPACGLAAEGREKAAEKLPGSNILRWSVCCFRQGYHVIQALQGVLHQLIRLDRCAYTLQYGLSLLVRPLLSELNAGAQFPKNAPKARSLTSSSPLESRASLRYWLFT
jgi:hypothetical protein